MYTKILLQAKKLQNELNNSPGIIPSCSRDDKPHPSGIDTFSQLITDNDLRKTVEKLYRDGHHARAVEEAYKFVDNLVKRTANPSDSSLSGSKLMTTAFNVKMYVVKGESEISPNTTWRLARLW